MYQEVPALTSKRAKMVGDENGSDSTSEQMVVPVSKVAALSFLPEEIIDKIFSHLDSAKDLHAVSNTNEQFNRILAPSKPIWAFETVFPNIFSKLEQQDILNCRLVCKKWCQAVDQDLQSRPSSRNDSVYPSGSTQQVQNRHRPLYAPNFQKSLIAKGFRHVMLTTSGDIRNFLKQMRDHTRNPLVLRSVFLYKTRVSEDYWKFALSFLKRFGHEIWYISISNWDNDDFYDLIVQILGLLPNLRTLRVCGIFKGQVTSPLPPLPHLQALEDMVVREHPFLDELLKTYSRQLQVLRCLKLSQWERYQTSLKEIPLVKEISMDINDRIHTWRHFCHELVAPNLVKLTLDVWMSCSISSLLQPLAKNLQSLRYLSLQFGRAPKDFGLLTPPRFVLENVKTLEIVDSCLAEYNQLFQHMPALEYLLVHHEQYWGNFVAFDDPTQWELFDWISGPSIEKSDIWTRLTHLKELTLARRFG